MPNFLDTYKDPDLGTTIQFEGEEYTIERFLGSGGMASAYQTKNSKGDKVVFKIYKNLTREAREKVQTGYQIRRRFPDISKKKLVFPQNGNFTHTKPAVIYNYVEGDTTGNEADLMTEVDQKVHTGRRLISEVMPTLELLRKKGIAHRDLKGGNLIMDKNEPRTTLLDFDFVTEIDNMYQSTVWGTPYFISPEQAEGRTSETMDIFSLGVTVVDNYFPHLATTARLTNGDTSPFEIVRYRHYSPLTRSPEIQKQILNLDAYPESIRAETYGLLKFIIAALQPDPNERPRSAKESSQLLAMTPNISMHYGTIQTTKTPRITSKLKVNHKC